MSDSEVLVRVGAKLDPSVRRALAGVTKEAVKSEAQIRRESERTEKARVRSAERAEAGIQKASERAASGRRRLISGMLRDFTRAEEAKRREHEKTIREAEALERRRAQGAARIQAAIDRQSRPLSSASGGRGAGAGRRGASFASGSSDGGGLSAMLGPVGGLAGIVAAVAGAVSIYSSRVQNSSRIIGMQDTEETLSKFQELEMELNNTLMDAQFNSGMSEETAGRIRESVWAQVEQRGTDPEEIISMLGTAQGRFDMLSQFADSMDEIGQVSLATRASMGSLGAVLGGASQQMNLSADQYGEAMGILAQQASTGSVEFSNLANEFGPVLGAFAAVRGGEGLDAITEFGALAQVMGTLGVGAAETATVMERFLAGLTEGDRVERFRELGIELTDPATGLARPVEDIARDMAANRALDNPRIFDEVVGGDVNQKRGFRALRERQIREPEFLSRMMAADGAAGQEQFAARERMVEGLSSHQARLVRGRNIAAISRQGESLVAEHTERARATARFEGENPRAAEWIPDSVLPAVAAVVTPYEQGRALPFRDARTGQEMGPTGARVPTATFASASAPLVGALTGAATPDRATDATERLAAEQARAREATTASTAATIDLATAIRGLGQRPGADTGADTDL